MTGSELGNKAVPNEGFLATAVVPLGTGSEALCDNNGDGDSDDDGDSDVDNVLNETDDPSGPVSAAGDPDSSPPSLGGLSIREASGPSLTSHEDTDKLLEMTLLQVSMDSYLFPQALLMMIL